MRLRLIASGTVAIAALTTAAVASAAGHPVQLDRNLVVPLPTGWTSAGGPNANGGEFVVAGNFALRPTIQQLGSGQLPEPPAGKVIVRIVDLAKNAHLANWKHVNRLQLPPALTGRSAITWNVEFANEAVQVSAKTGSLHVTVTEMATIDRFLGEVRHR
jgi:hypothetical protein